MIRRSIPLAGQAPFSTVVVGGGTIGCYIAARLGMDGQRVALVEQGPDVSKLASWAHAAPCAKYMHRLRRSNFESYTPAGPQRSFDSDEKRDVEIPGPCVLGGSGVVGGKSWFLGLAADWEETSWSFRDDIRPQFLDLECLETAVPHRGKHGRFMISRPAGTSQLYKPFCEAVSELKYPLLVEMNGPTADMACGAGRPEVLVDPRDLLALNTYRCHLLEALKMKRDITVLPQTRAIRVESEGGVATGVTVADASGAERLLEASTVILAGGAIENPRLLQRSPSLGVPEATGANFFDRPAVILQYQCAQPITHHVYDSTLTQFLALVAWQRGEHNAVTSAYDDMVCFWSPKGSGAQPEAKITMQPFAMNNRGVFHATPHGLQFVIELIYPKSRGRVTAEAADPAYFTDAADRELMEKAVAFTKKIAQCAALRQFTGKEEPIATLFEGTGTCGGTVAAGSCVDPRTFELKGTSNLFVLGASAFPRPICGDMIPNQLALAGLFVDGVFTNRDRLESKAVDEQADASEVKVTYY